MDADYNSLGRMQVRMYVGKAKPSCIHTQLSKLLLNIVTSKYIIFVPPSRYVIDALGHVNVLGRINVNLTL